MTLVEGRDVGGGVQVGSVPATRVLAFDRVGKRFADGTVAVRDIDLTVEAGEFVSVVGPSGCGKSTLLRLASGLSRPSAGRVHTGSAEIGYVFQDPNLLAWRSVAENVELGAELKRLPERDRRRRVEAALDLVGLRGVERQLPRMLSGGMRMRVSLARCLALDPDLCLFDEPFGALDELTRERLDDELLALHRARRFSGLFVTHSVSEAVYLSTRVVLMSPRPGRIVADLPVPFGPSRGRELRFTAEFTDLVARVSHGLRDDEL